MLHTVIVASTWLVGAFGASGAIAAIAASIYLGPAAVQAIIAPLLTRFLACTKCVIATVFVLATLGSYWLGHHEAEAKCRADELNSRIAAQQADLEAANQAKADEKARADLIESKANDQHQKDIDFITRLKANPACGFDPDAGDGLRNPHAASEKPSSGSVSPPKPTTRAASRFRMPLSLVQGQRMSGKRSERDAPSDGK